MKSPHQVDLAFRMMLLILAAIVLAALFREWVVNTPVQKNSAWPTQP